MLPHKEKNNKHTTIPIFPQKHENVTKGRRISVRERMKSGEKIKIHYINS